MNDTLSKNDSKKSHENITVAKTGENSDEKIGEEEHNLSEARALLEVAQYCVNHRFSNSM